MQSQKDRLLLVIALLLWCASFNRSRVGVVYAWGNNAQLALGDGTNANRLTPTLVIGLTNVKQIAGSYINSMAIRQDGTAWAWGHDHIQTREGVPSGRSIPGRMNSLTGVIAVAGGGTFDLTLRSDGTVWGCGLNREGQVGDGTTTRRWSPVQVRGLTGVSAISCADYHSLALRRDGTVWAWGINAVGELGDRTTINRTTPVQVSALSNVIAISAGGQNSVALRKDGTVWAWGHNSFGQLGTGTNVFGGSTTPIQVVGLSGVTAIACGGGHMLALKSDGTVWAWGSNGAGQLGISPNDVLAHPNPTQISGLPEITAISCGARHSIALTKDGTVWTWGGNDLGQLGDGTTVERWKPQQVKGLDGVSAIAAGGLHSLAVGSVVR